MGAKLEHIITRLAQEVDDEKAKGNEARVKPSDEHFWFRRPNIVLYLIHFILFQNSFEIAFFFWIWVRTSRMILLAKRLFLFPFFIFFSSAS